LLLQGLEIARDVTSWIGIGWSQRALGRLALASGAQAEATLHFREALDTFTAIEARAEIARTQLALARIVASG
jgi:hypothetical protein